MLYRRPVIFRCIAKIKQDGSSSTCEIRYGNLVIGSKVVLAVRLSGYYLGPHRTRYCLRILSWPWVVISKGHQKVVSYREP